MPLDGRNWKPETETKPDVFSLEGLIAWLETQPPTISYDWNNCRGACLVGRYFVAMGVYNDPYRPSFGEMFYPRFPFKSYGMVCMTKPWTYGAALSRARALLASHPKE